MEWHPPREVALGILDALFGEARDGSVPAGPAGPAAAGPAAASHADAVAGRGPGGTGDAGWTHPLTAFQTAAVGRLRGILARRGGAVLADAVGLGKTYVALALVEERLRAGGDVVVAIPAALRGLWRGPLRRLERTAGKAPVRLVSHAQLSRGVAIRTPRGPGRRLVVVDEAHRFRNPATRRYATLTRLMARAAGAGAAEPPEARPLTPELLLITATPINNALDDLYHLLRLFLRDDGLRDAGVASLGGVFEGPDPAGVRTVVRELVVRRSRGVIDARFGETPKAPGSGSGPEPRSGGSSASGATVSSAIGPAAAPASFPERAPPVIHRYASPGIRDRVATIEALELAAYGPGAAPLLRLGLLKRLDSSPAALVVSVGRVREFLAAFRDAAAAGRLLRPGDRRIGGDADPFQLLLLGVVADPAPPELDLEALVAATERDLDRLRRLDASPGSAGSLARPAGLPLERAPPDGGDAKVEALVALLGSLEGERVLVFTEYRDSAEAVWRALLPGFRVARIDGAGAWLGPGPAGRRRVVERFAPTANGRREPPERERVDVLVATDVLAEGLNLQDARHVVSYDLPWNPVRLLQRIGRIDRLGSTHDTVVPHLFVPAEGLDAVLGLTRRLRRKLHGIASALGEERADELLEGLAAGRADRVEVALRTADRDGEDPTEALRTLWVRDARGRGAPAPAGQPRWAWIPGATGATDVMDDVAAVVLAGRRLLEVLRDGSVREPTAATVGIVQHALEAEEAQPSPPRAQDVERRAAAAVDCVTAHLRQRALMAHAPAPVAPSRPAARLTRRIRRALAAAGAGAGPDSVRRVGAVLEALEAPPVPAVERAVVRLLNDSDPPDGVDRLDGLLPRSEAALGTANPTATEGPDPAPTAAPSPARIQAVLLTGRELSSRPGQTG